MACPGWVFFYSSFDRGVGLDDPQRSLPCDSVKTLDKLEGLSWEDEKGVCSHRLEHRHHSCPRLNLQGHHL